MDSPTSIGSVGAVAFQAAGSRARTQATPGFDSLLSSLDRAGTGSHAGRAQAVPAGSGRSRAEQNGSVGQPPRARDGSGAAAPNSARDSRTARRPGSRPSAQAADAKDTDVRTSGDTEPVDDAASETGAADGPAHEEGRRIGQRRATPPDGAAAAAHAPAGALAVPPPPGEAIVVEPRSQCPLDAVVAAPGAGEPDEATSTASAWPSTVDPTGVAPVVDVLSLAVATTADASTGEPGMTAAAVDGGGSEKVAGEPARPAAAAAPEAGSIASGLPAVASHETPGIAAAAFAALQVGPGAEADSPANLEDVVQAQPPANDTATGEVATLDEGARLLKDAPEPAVPGLATGSSARDVARRLVSAALAGAMGQRGQSGVDVTPVGPSNGNEGAAPSQVPAGSDGARPAPAPFVPVVTPATLFGEGRAAASADAAAAPPVDLLSFAMAGVADARSQSQGGGRGWSGSRPDAAVARAVGLAPTAHASQVAQVVAPPFVDAIQAGTVFETGASEATARTGGAADSPIGQQVVRAISLAWRDGVGEARVRLNPEHLGEVSVALRVEKGVVSAVLQAETPAAREWIQAHESELRQALESQGLALDALVVTSEGESRGRQDAQARPRRPAPKDDGQSPRFEVNV